MSCLQYQGLCDRRGDKADMSHGQTGILQKNIVNYVLGILYLFI